MNSRNLDLRLRLPSGFEGLEIRARGLAQEKLARGNCTINLWVKRESGQMEIRLNEAALGQARAVAARAHDLTGLKPPRLDTLLGMSMAFCFNSGDGCDCSVMARKRRR